jgi:hypothetical protein
MKKIMKKLSLGLGMGAIMLACTPALANVTGGLDQYGCSVEPNAYRCDSMVNVTGMQREYNNGLSPRVWNDRVYFPENAVMVRNANEEATVVRQRPDGSTYTTYTTRPY